ncbi:MAG TPA: hypothetical protein VGB89_15225 [Bacteroidota bacterium]
MIQISFTEPYELDISSTVENFIKLRESLSELLHSSRDELVVFAETEFDPAPYTHSIPKLVFRKVDGPAKVEVREFKEVIISGSASALDALSSFFTFERDATFPHHNHFEYYEGNPVIHPESIPIIVSIADTK